MKTTTPRAIARRALALATIAATTLLLCSCPRADDGPEQSSCDRLDLDSPVIDFHAHTFNFRHLPLRGILYGWGVPDYVASEAADLIWAMTASIDDEDADRFSTLRFGADDARTTDFRTRAMDPGIDYFAAAEEPLSPDARQRFEAELNEYLVAELAFEQSQPAELGVGAPTPLNDFFRDLRAMDPATPDAGAFATDRGDAALDAMASLSLTDRLVALLLRPFGLEGEVEGAYRFFETLIQAEDEVAEQLFADYCSVDYFVHYMMDLEHVYANRPPVSFFDQHDVVRRVRESTGERLISFSAFVPFRFDDHNLTTIKAAVASGAVGAKYYPPSGYGMTVDEIPKKPKRWRGLIYQGGARKQWEYRYAPLDSAQLRENWGITINDPDKAREETLLGVSDRFFDFAADEDLIVFAHQSPGGFEAYKGYGSVFAEPCDFLPVLEEHPDFLLVLGHAGGYSWYADDAGFDDSFAQQAYNMCVSYENVYCDFGYHEEVLTAEGQDALRSRLEEMHRTSLTPDAVELTPQACRTEAAPMKYPIFDKIVYGSDWMMVVRESDYLQMISGFDSVFTGELEQYKERFFGENAIRILQKSGNADALPEDLRP